MSFPLFFTIDTNKQHSNLLLTTGLAKIGHNNHNIDQVWTIKDEEERYLVVEFFQPPDISEWDNVIKSVKRLDDVTLVETTEQRRDLFNRCKNKEQGTRVKNWFEHARYVSPNV